MSATRWAILGLVLAACAGDEPEKLVDTGWFDDPPFDPEACGARVAVTEPADGETGWYWRDALRLYVEEADGTYEVRLTDALGRDVPVEVAPADDSGLVLAVAFEGGLAPLTEHRLELTDCGGPRTVTFTTSELGQPLEGGPRALLDRTYELQLVSADWVEPGGFGPILASTFETPILVGVEYADERVMDWVGGQGYVIVGEIRQDPGEPTWNFPVTDFSEAPYFETAADRVELAVSGYPLPVTSFELSGTFVADGSRFGGGVLKGLGDTRYAGGALGTPGVEGAFCNLASGLGIDCLPCPDGEVFCLQVELRDLVGLEVEGLTLQTVLADD